MMLGPSVPAALAGQGLAAHKFEHGLPRPTSRSADLCAAPGADRARDRAHEIARERIRHDGACDRRRRPRRLVRRRDDQRRQRRACADLRHSLRCSSERRGARRAPRCLWRADAWRPSARRDRRMALSQEGAALRSIRSRPTLCAADACRSARASWWRRRP